MFLLARAVSALRPEFILPATLSATELSRLLQLSVKAFGPRQTGKPTDEVATWKRELPYRASKRLQDLFKEQLDLDPTAQSYRVAVRRTLQRIALLVCGDLLAAKNVLFGIDVPAAQDPATASLGYVLRLGDGELSAQTEAEADFADLCAFFVAPQHAPLFDKLHPV